MRVYRFLPSSFGLKTIRENRMHISKIMDLNDPFEFLGAVLEDEIMWHAMNAVRNKLASNRGVICFSEASNNPLLWSHYADKHKGICLGVEFPDENLTKILYRKNRIPVGNSIDSDLMKKILSTKFSHWRYEREYRAFLSLDKAASDGNYYLDFSDQIQLKEIIIGANSELARKDVIDALDSRSKGIKMFKARPALKTFKVTKNMKQDLWK